MREASEQGKKTTQKVSHANQITYKKKQDMQIYQMQKDIGQSKTIRMTCNKKITLCKSNNRNEKYIPKLVVVLVFSQQISETIGI